MQKFFITATGTGIGKTLVATALCHQLKLAGKKVAALKPVISGYEAADMQNDSALILQSLALSVTTENIEKISPWRFAAPLSPNMAGARENKNIPLEKLISFCKEQEKIDADILLVEGVGGICVPLNNTSTVLDWLAALDGWKIILVTGSYLGAISHTLTAVQALSASRLSPHSLVISESEGSPATLEETTETLSQFLPKRLPIITIPRQNSAAEAWKAVPPISGICL